MCVMEMKRQVLAVVVTTIIMEPTCCRTWSLSWLPAENYEWATRRRAGRTFRHPLGRPPASGRALRFKPIPTVSTRRGKAVKGLLPFGWVYSTAIHVYSCVKRFDFSSERIVLNAAGLESSRSLNGLKTVMDVFDMVWSPQRALLSIKMQ